MRIYFSILAVRGRAASQLGAVDRRSAFVFVSEIESRSDSGAAIHSSQLDVYLLPGNPPAGNPPGNP